MEKKSLKLFILNAVRQLFGLYTNCVLIVVLTLYFGSGIYKIENNEIGVLTRFGKVDIYLYLPKTLAEAEDVIKQALILNH